MAMAMAVAGLVAEGETEIEDFACHKVSFPNFYPLLKKWENG
jgi:5-enolpyruvylshikimate-3-phosphate synthase